MRRVLAAMEIISSRAMGAVRLSVGRYSTPEEIARAAEVLMFAWRRLTQQKSRSSTYGFCRGPRLAAHQACLVAYSRPGSRIES